MQGGRSTGLALPRKATDDSQPRGDLLQKDASQTRGEQDGAVAISFVTVDRCLRVSRVIPGWHRGEWVQVYNPCGVKTIRIAAYSVMYNS